jgi:hypothetical protein
LLVSDMDVPFLATPVKTPPMKKRSSQKLER